MPPAYLGGAFRARIRGVNVDDLGDYRPGQNAARLHQVKAPLVDAKLSKAEIRELSHRALQDAVNREVIRPVLEEAGFATRGVNILVNPTGRFAGMGGEFVGFESIAGPAG